MQNAFSVCGGVMGGWGGQRAAIVLFGVATCGTAHAQRADENPISQARDAFGVSVGNEKIGLYTDTEVRGFSPISAGNTRLEGLYFDRQGVVTGRLVMGSTIRVGLTAQAHPFSAPTGLVDYRLRQAGERPVRSVVAATGPFGAHQLDIDVQQPLGGGLSLAGGVSYRIDEATRGDTVKYLSRGLIADWRASERVRLRAFWGRFEISEDHTTPFIFPGSAVPPAFERRYYGQSWATAEGFSQLYGAIAEAGLPGGWDMRGGVFASDFVDEEPYTDLYSNVQADGSASHALISGPPQVARSVSGEVRLGRRFDRGGVRHGLHGLVRARRLQGAYGGTDLVRAPTGQVGVAEPLARPAFVFRPRSELRVEQETLGVGYTGDWSHLNLTLSLQRSRYRKRVREPGGFVGVARDAPWLPGGSAAYQVRPTVLAYASYARGLEESGPVPENARNFPGTLPALRTSQRDAGVRWDLTPNLRLVTGVFEVRKPYFNLDADGRFVRLGSVSNRGLEVSLTGRPRPGLTLVAGAVLSDPKVNADGSAVPIGDQPVGMPRRTARASLEQMLPDGRTSIDASLAYVGARPVNAANTLEVGGYTTLDLGLRHRFQIGETPASLRLQVLNAANAFGWKAFPGGAIQPIEPRRAILTLAADF